MIEINLTSEELHLLRVAVGITINKLTIEKVPNLPKDAESAYQLLLDNLKNIEKQLHSKLS